MIVFERKIAMPAGSPREPGNLTLHGDRVKARLQAVGYGPEQGADRPDARTGRRGRRFFKHDEAPQNARDNIPQGTAASPKDCICTAKTTGNPCNPLILNNLILLIISSFRHISDSMRLCEGFDVSYSQSYAQDL